MCVCVLRNHVLSESLYEYISDEHLYRGCFDENNALTRRYCMSVVNNIECHTCKSELAACNNEVMLHTFCVNSYEISTVYYSTFKVFPNNKTDDSGHCHNRHRGKHRMNWTETAVKFGIIFAIFGAIVCYEIVKKRNKISGRFYPQYPLYSEPSANQQNSTGLLNGQTNQRNPQPVCLFPLQTRSFD